MQLYGVATPYDSDSRIIHEKGLRFVERFRQGAFTRALQKHGDRFLLYAHDAQHVLSRSLNGSLRLFEDSRGLNFEADLADTTLGRDVAKLVAGHFVSGMSIGFWALQDEFFEDRQAKMLRRDIIESDFDEITVTAFPCYLFSVVSQRTAKPKPISNLPAKLAAIRRRMLEIKNDV